VKHKTGKTARHLTAAVLCKAQDRQDNTPAVDSYPDS